MSPVPLLNPKLLGDVRRYWLNYKYDGWRLIVDKGKFFSRRGNELKGWIGLDRFKDLGYEYPLDCELMTLDMKRTSIPSVKNQDVAVLIILDVIVEDVPIEDRISLFPSIYNNCRYKHCEFYSIENVDDINRYLEQAIRTGYCDGIVLKKKNSLYYPGREEQIMSVDWIKVKERIKENKKEVI